MIMKVSTIFFIYIFIHIYLYFMLWYVEFCWCFSVIPSIISILFIYRRKNVLLIATFYLRSYISYLTRIWTFIRKVVSFYIKYFVTRYDFLLWIKFRILWSYRRIFYAYIIEKFHTSDCVKQLIIIVEMWAESICIQRMGSIYNRLCNICHPHLRMPYACIAS